MASGYKADIEDFHRYRVLLDSISEVGIPCRGDSKCKGPGVGERVEHCGTALLLTHPCYALLSVLYRSCMAVVI